jgi:hypothetical protein
MARKQHVGEFPSRPDAYAGNFPPFKQPKIVGHFSLTNEREYHPDARNAGYFVHPECKPDGGGGDGRRGRSRGVLVEPFDLNLNADKTVKKKELLDEGIVHLLRWISLNKEQVKAQGPADQRFV